MSLILPDSTLMHLFWFVTRIEHTRMAIVDSLYAVTYAATDRSSFVIFVLLKFLKKGSDTAPLRSDLANLSSAPAAVSANVSSPSTIACTCTDESVSSLEATYLCTTCSSRLAMTVSMHAAMPAAASAHFKR
jgi:hypothetical protein